MIEMPPEWAAASGVGEGVDVIFKTGLINSKSKSSNLPFTVESMGSTNWCR